MPMVWPTRVGDFVVHGEGICSQIISDQGQSRCSHAKVNKRCHGTSCLPLLSDTMFLHRPAGLQLRCVVALPTASSTCCYQVELSPASRPSSKCVSGCDMISIIAVVCPLLARSGKSKFERDAQCPTGPTGQLNWWHDMPHEFQAN